MQAVQPLRESVLEIPEVYCTKCGADPNAPPVIEEEPITGVLLVSAANIFKKSLNKKVSFKQL